MIFQYRRAVLSLCGVVTLLGISACGQVLGLDDYTKSASGGGGNGGKGGEGGGTAGQGGSAGQGGQGGQGGMMMTECQPTTSMPCYDGPLGTNMKGICKSGTKTCGADGTYGACIGQVTPQVENCATTQDEDCNGAAASCLGEHIWSKSFGTMANQQNGNVVRGLSDGSVVVFGDFLDAIDFECKTLTASTGITDIFLLKLDPQGNCLFAKSFGNAQTVDYAYDMAIASNDDIILFGGYAGTSIDFGGGSMACNGSNDTYLARFDKDGNFLWSKHYGDTSDQLGYGVSVDSQGNIHIVGNFGGTIDFGNGIGVTNNQFGYMAGFYAKLDSKGDPILSKSFSGTNPATDAVDVSGVVVDSAGNATVVGRFKGNLTVPSGPTLTALGTAGDIFAIHYDPSGQVLWAHRFGAMEEDWNPEVALGLDDSIYISGTTTGTSLNLMDLGGTSVSGQGGGDVFLVKLNPDSTIAAAKVFGDTMAQGNISVTVDPVGHVILGGYFKGTLDFGSTTKLMSTTQTIYVAKFDTSLKNLMARNFFSTQAENAIHVGADLNANILLTGGFYGDLQIKVGGALPNKGPTDIFVAKLTP